MLRNANKVSSALVRNVSLYHRNNKLFKINSNSDFAIKVIKCPVPVIVNFHAEWCEPCKILTARLTELVEPLENVHLAIVDVDFNPELVDTFEVKAVPAVIAMSNGLVIHKFIGLDQPTMMETLIKKLSENQLESESEKTGI